MACSCCYAVYDNMFDCNKADQDLKAYLSSGVKKNSRHIRDLLLELEVNGKHILDIGAGVGALIFEAFSRGAVHATHVDISEAYSDAFGAESSRRDIEDKVERLIGDFNTIARDIASAEIVTLDKVICCYPEYEELIKLSTDKAEKWYLYSVPRDVWWVHIGQKIDDIVQRWKGRYFKTYIHPVKKMDALITVQGFRLKERRYQREWMTALFERVA